MNTGMKSNHRSLLKNVTGTVTPAQDEGISEFNKLKPTRLTDNAFVRIETVADLFDAIFLAVSGTNVEYQPISGTLNGFSVAAPGAMPGGAQAAAPAQAEPMANKPAWISPKQWR